MSNAPRASINLDPHSAPLYNQNDGQTGGQPDGFGLRGVSMDSSMIGKIDKARRYAEQKDRVTITSLKATFQGNHNTHEVDFDSGS